MLWKAQQRGLAELTTIDLRQFGLGPRRTVDDTPYGGGDGMLLRVEPLWEAVRHAKERDPTAKVLIMTPRGQRWNQALAQQYSQTDHGYIFICGRYEGYDERIMQVVDQTLRVGDYVLTGGELAAMTMIDATVRLIPEVIGKESSHQDDSFSSGLLEYPQYTRPYDYRGMVVPDVLMSGHHENIRQWRLYESLKKTYERRPDLLENYQLTVEEEKMLAEIKENKE